jgi:hypothetical protein
MRLVNLSKLQAYSALLSQPSSDEQKKQMRSHVTAPRIRPPLLAEYQQRTTAYLMYRELARNGDL